MGLSLRNVAKKIGEGASRVYDQAQIFDNGLSYQTRQVNPAVANRSALQQAAPIGTAFIKAPVQFANTSNLAARQAVEGFKMGAAALTGNATAGVNAANAADFNYDRFANPNSGLLGQGSFFKNAAEAKQGDFKTAVTRIGGGTLATAATIAPFAKGGVLAAKAGKIGVPRLLAQGAATGGAFSVGDQLQDNGRIDPKRLAIDTAIGAAGNAAVPVVKLAGKSGAKAAQDAGLTSLTPRINAEQVNALKTVSDFHAGAPGVKASDFSAAMKVARKAAKEQGVDITSGTPVQRHESVNALLDQLGKQNKQYSQGGYVRVKGDKPKVSAKQNAAVKAALRTAKMDELATKIPMKKQSGVDLAFRSTNSVLERIDPRLSKGVTQRREIAESGAALAKSKLKVTNSLSKSEQTNFARVMKGTEKPLNDKVKAAAEESRKVLNEVYYRAKAAGVDMPKYRKNYFPQIHNPKVFNEGSRQGKDAVKHLIATKQAKNEADAIEQLRKFRNVKTMSPYQNLSKARSLDLPGYAENVPALHQYLDRAYATIGHTKVFGKNEKTLNKILGEVQKNGGDYEQAIKSYRQASGLNRGSDIGEKLSRGATNFQGATKLGLSSLGNFTQNANTAVVAGTGRTGKAALKQFNKADREFVKKTGVTDEQVAHEALFGEQGVSQKLRNITAPGFEQIEKMNRSIAATAGRDMANSLAKKALKGDTKAAQRLADEFGIDKIGKKGLTEEQQIAAARRIVERTQFRTGQQDLPGWTTTPTGRVVSQFKRYPYKQAQFLGREVIKPATQGNVLPAVRLAAVGAPLALGSNYAVDKIRGTEFEQSTPEKALDMANTVTGANIVTGLASSLYPSSHDANAYTSKVAKTLGGPTVSDAVKGVQAGFESAKEGKHTNSGRFALQHVPVVGTPASSRLLPYANSKEGDKGSKTATDKNGEKVMGMNDRIKNAFNTPEAKEFLKLGAADQKALAATDPAARQLYDQIAATRKAFSTPDLLAPGLDEQSAKTLRLHDRLTTGGRDKMYARDKSAEFNYSYAKYQNDKLSGKLTEIEDIRAQNNLAKKFIGRDYDKTIRDAYGLAKKDMKRYISEHPEQANALLAYDKALADAGLISEAKFKYGVGGSAAGKSAAEKDTLDSHKYDISFNAGSSKVKAAPKVSVAVRKPAKSKVGTKTGRSKVAIKKSAV